MQRQLEDPISRPDWEGHRGIFGLGELQIFVGETGIPLAREIRSVWDESVATDFPYDIRQRVILDLIRFYNKYELSYAVWVWMIYHPLGTEEFALVNTPPDYKQTDEQVLTYQTLKSEFAQ